jgi:hypothetical protein
MTVELMIRWVDLKCLQKKKSVLALEKMKVKCQILMVGRSIFKILADNFADIAISLSMEMKVTYF